MVEESKIDNKVVLISIDGWGLSTEKEGNAILNAKTPIMDSLEKDETFLGINASGLHVGLPKGIMGNSEVGHLTMGAGRVKYQDLVRINASMENDDAPNSFKKNKILLNACKNANNTTKRLHFLGLVSNGGVHSHINHLKEFLRVAKSQSVEEIYIHFFADGRDTKPTSSPIFINELQDFLDKEINNGKISTITGRYYAMDRDKRWERIEIAYDALVNGKGSYIYNDDNKESDKYDRKYETKLILSEIAKQHEAKVQDQYLKPMIVNKNGLIKDNDTLIFIDFRADRMREIVETFGIKPNHNVDKVLKGLHIVQMTQYSKEFPFPVLYPPQTNKNVLGEWISKKGLKQFHTAETEKYAHVTFFFNGGIEKQFEGEERSLIQSPKVASYNLKPEMSADGVTKSVVGAIESDKYAFIVCNYAPPDMVGHTGHYNETVTACEVTDKGIGEIYESCKKNGYVLVVTSDHGNAESMLDENKEPKTSHTTNLVPLIIANKPDNAKLTEKEGGLADVAPTILAIMGLDQPEDMTGKSLVQLE